MNVGVKTAEEKEKEIVRRGDVMDNKVVVVEEDEYMGEGR